MDGSAAPGQNSGQNSAATADTSTVDPTMIVVVACVYGVLFLCCCLMCARCGLCDCLWCMCTRGVVEEPCECLWCMYARGVEELTEETAVCVPEAVTVVHEEQRLPYQGELRGIVVVGVGSQ